MWLSPGFVGVIVQWKRVCHRKVRVKILRFVLAYVHEFCPVESKCITHLRSVMRMKIMLNNEDTLHFRQERENIA